MSKKKSFQLKPLYLLIAAAVLLVVGTVGSIQAVLAYYSENYLAQVNVSHIGITLLENGKQVSRRNYIENDTWDEVSGELLADILAKGEELVLGKTYAEELSVENSGAIDAYVRVIIKKSWQNAEGVKVTKLSPDLIDLNLVTGDGWVLDESASTAERTVLYYTDILPAGAVTPAFTDTIRIDPAVATKIVETVKKEMIGGKEYKTITYAYEYDGYTFHVDVEVDAVQTHNSEDAIKSAWGVDMLMEPFNVMAEEYEGSKNWTVSFDGERMNSNFKGAVMADDILNIQPGDGITLQVNLKNEAANKADWYMTNEVLQTLEESNDSAEDGAYTYILKYVDPAGGETVLYSSEVVGGEEDNTDEGEGLHQATVGLEDYFYLGRLSKDETAVVRLYVQFEGETLGNAYQDTLAKLQMNFAVEDVADGTVVKTGDQSSVMWFSAAALGCGLLLLILALLDIRLNRQKKGEQQ